MAFIAAFVVMLGVAFGLPAYAQVTKHIEVPVAQSIPQVKVIKPPVVLRDNYTVTAPPALVWPVDLYSQVSDGFGSRISPCSGCSSYHEGADLVAGWGNQVRAIAAGVVTETNSPSSSSLGVHVTIQHLIDGQVVSSVYGHMQYGSMTLQVGDTVYAGQPIGLVGNTGASTGPHLHFEIRLGGTEAVDPLAWMHARLG